MHWIVLGIVGLTLVVSASRFPRLAFSLLGVLCLLAILVLHLLLVLIGQLKLRAAKRCELCMGSKLELYYYGISR